jgi:hypothetical protein
MIDVLMNPGAPPSMRQAIDLTLAREMLDNLASYTRKPMPPKPIDIEGFTDRTLVDKVRFISASSRASKDERELVSAFTTWRYSVMTIESENMGRVESLLYAARKLAPLAKEYAEQARDLRELATFLEAEWEVSIDPMPTMGEAQRIAYHAAFERETLPNCLRALDNATFPSSAFVAPPKAKRGGEPARIGSWMQKYDNDESEEA